MINEERVLTENQAFRAAFFLVDQYLALEGETPAEALVLFRQYVWSDPACSEDWQRAIDRALGDEVEPAGPP